MTVRNSSLMISGAVAAERDGETVDDEAGHGGFLEQQSWSLHDVRSSD